MEQANIQMTNIEGKELLEYAEKGWANTLMCTATERYDSEIVLRMLRKLVAQGGRLTVEAPRA